MAFANAAFSLGFLPPMTPVAMVKVGSFAVDAVAFEELPDPFVVDAAAFVVLLGAELPHPTKVVTVKADADNTVNTRRFDFIVKITLLIRSYFAGNSDMIHGRLGLIERFDVYLVQCYPRCAE